MQVFFFSSLLDQSEKCFFLHPALIMRMFFFVVILMSENFKKNLTSRITRPYDGAVWRMKATNRGIVDQNNHIAQSRPLLSHNAQFVHDSHPLSSDDILPNKERSRLLFNKCFDDAQRGHQEQAQTTK